jgi:hypothetical protein
MMKIMFKAIWYRCTEILWGLLFPFVEGWEMLVEYVSREEERRNNG